MFKFMFNLSSSLGKCLSFDGGDYVLLSSAISSYLNNQSFSISGWKGLYELEQI